MTRSSGLPSEAGDPVVDRVSSLLGIGTLAVVAAVALGSLLMVAAGRTPIEQHGPPIDLPSIPAGLVGLQPEGWLWLGLLLTIVLPVARVALALLGFARGGERRMSAISVATLAVLASSTVLALATR